VTERESRRVVLITGVAGGIGAACARAFAEAGWAVAGLGLSAEAAGHVERHASIDLAGADVEARLEAFIGELPRIDAVVNNAALQIVKPLRDTTADEWDRMQAVNLRAAYLVIRIALPQLRSARGAVINVGSVHAVATSPGLAGYAASKGGLVTLTRAAALELAADGIRVNAVLPGAIDTAMLRAGAERFGDEGMARIAARVPLGRVGSPDDVARAVLFLAGPGAGYVTGATLAVDGGVLAALSSE
jgi:NAD(P)-dependent dehydrogenase (short-subunit alcohol dehydrogenase family)